MESGKKTKEIWIHRALNVFVNDRSQLAELEERAERREQTRLMFKKNKNKKIKNSDVKMNQR